MEDAEVAAVGAAVACTGAGGAAEVIEVIAVDGGGTPYNIVEVVTVLAVDPGRLTLMLLTPLLAEDTVEAVEAVAAEEAAVGVGNSVVPEESVCICS